MEFGSRSTRITRFPRKTVNVCAPLRLPPTDLVQVGGLNTGMRYFRSPSFHRHRPRLAGGYCAVERCAADQRSELQGCSVLRRSPLCTGVCVLRGQQCSRKTLLSNECGHGARMFRTCKCRVPIPVFKDSDTDSSSFLLAHCVIPIAARSAALVSH